MAPRGVTFKMQHLKQPPDPPDKSPTNYNTQSSPPSHTQNSTNNATSPQALTPPPPRNLPRGATHRRLTSTPPSTTNSNNATPSPSIPQRYSFQPRRSGTFYNGTASTPEGNDDARLPRLRRGSTMFMVSPAKDGVEGKVESGGVVARVKRGSTMFFKGMNGGVEENGKMGGGGGGEVDEEVEKKVREKKLWEEEGKVRWEHCGMCGACGKLPEWAPERLKGKGKEMEKEKVRRVMIEKEARGKLERTMREKRIEEQVRAEKEKAVMNADEAFIKTGVEGENGDERRNEDDKSKKVLDEEVDNKGYSVDVKTALDTEDGDFDEIDLESTSSTSDGTTAAVKIEDDEPSVLGDVDVMSGEVVSSTAERNQKENGEQTLHNGNGITSVGTECKACEALEAKVQHLEDQVDLLKEVVELTRKGKSECDVDKKNKGWKMFSSYYGSGSSTSEKNELRREVDALRKTTDVLFNKLQDSNECE